ncbi:MAG: pyridoxamine 5'-phosphate oxidase family protein, partial [Deltaproteobacteria bacterium]|nr:pyridoxamine 5'-phosphate oxidase family protein [Deltaproteobacteria bacterium]
GHKTVATLRRDGSPRVSGTELTSYDGQLWLAGMPGALRFADLRRDPRFALHSGSDGRRCGGRTRTRRPTRRLRAWRRKSRILV